jgi:hypothetical protein
MRTWTFFLILTSFLMTDVAQAWFETPWKICNDFLIKFNPDLPAMWAEKAYAEEFKKLNSDAKKEAEQWLRRQDELVDESFNGSLSYFQYGAKDGNDGLLRFLDAASGGKLLSQFAGLQRPATPVTLPSIEEVVKYYNARVDELIANGTIRAKDAVRPGRIFEVIDPAYYGSKMNEAFKLPALPDRLYLPWQKHFDPLKFKPYSGNRNQGIFRRMMGEGYFPLSDADSQLWNPVMNQTLHDYSHLAVLLKYPELMGLWRRRFQNQRRAETKVIGSNRGENRIIEARSGLPSRKIVGDATVGRNMVAFEILSLIRKESLPSFLTHLKLPSSLKTGEPLPDLPAVVAHLKTLNPELLYQTLDEINNLMPGSVHYVGGAAAEPISPIMVETHHNTGYQFGLTHFREMAADAARGYYRHRDDKTLNTFAEALGRLQLAILHTGNISPVEWIKEISRPRLAKKSKVRKFICESGIFDPETYVFKAHCF